MCWSGRLKAAPTYDLTAPSAQRFTSVNESHHPVV